jgi:transposase
LKKYSICAILYKNEKGEFAMELNEIIVELDEKLQITKKEIREKMLYIYCYRASEISNCTYCGSASSKVHSRYNRELADLPIAHYKVKLIVEVKKYICENADCTHKRFAEILPFASERAKRTSRLDEYIMEIGMKNSSVEAAKIIRKSHADISTQTVLRVIKKS